MPAIAAEELGRLFREHAPALYLYARQWRMDDEDIIQDAFVKLAQQSPPPEPILPWLYRVVRNEALQAGRSAARRRRRESRAGTAEIWFDTVGDVIDGREATRLLAELPIEQRELIVARVWGGLKFEELAELAGCSLPTAHRRYEAGLAALREIMEGTCKSTIPVAKTR